MQILMKNLKGFPVSKCNSDAIFLQFFLENSNFISFKTVETNRVTIHAKKNEKVHMFSTAVTNIKHTQLEMCTCSTGSVHILPAQVKACTCSSVRVHILLCICAHTQVHACTAQLKVCMCSMHMQLHNATMQTEELT